jgi:hypothetical protein
MLLLLTKIQMTNPLTLYSVLCINVIVTLKPKNAKMFNHFSHKEKVGVVQGHNIFIFSFLLYVSMNLWFICKICNKWNLLKMIHHHLNNKLFFICISFIFSGKILGYHNILALKTWFCNILHFYEFRNSSADDILLTVFLFACIILQRTSIIIKNV